MRERARPTRTVLNANVPARAEGIRGTIKTIKMQEGYGFVTHTATGEDYFFHRSACRDSEVPFDELRPDQEVEFMPVEGPKGLRAEQLWSV